MEGFVKKGRLINIHAGFDETSTLLQLQFPQVELKVFDFYNPLKHTERSIQRARKAIEPFPGTLHTETHSILLPDQCADTICIIFAAHEIRDMDERISFFKEMKRIADPQAKIIVVEHLRDLPNFLAYTIGFFHFLSLASWKKTFTDSGLQIHQEIQLNPFIKAFILQPHAIAS
jgi:hypothetical protein